MWKEYKTKKEKQIRKNKLIDTDKKWWLSEGKGSEGREKWVKEVKCMMAGKVGELVVQML